MTHWTESAGTWSRSDGACQHKLVNVAVADGIISPGGYCILCGTDFPDGVPEQFERAGERGVTNKPASPLTQQGVTTPGNMGNVARRQRCKVTLMDGIRSLAIKLLYARTAKPAMSAADREWPISGGNG